MYKELQAGPVTLLQIFKGEREYVSPLFQRGYVWTNKNLELLWKDIDEILEGTESTPFLGAIVLEIKTSGLAFQPDSSWIVDGQQRLTTLYMVLMRIALEAERAEDKELYESLYRQYLFNQDGRYRNHPKLTPTLLDRHQFNDLFSSIRHVEPRLDVQFGKRMGGLQKANVLIGRSVRARCLENNHYESDKAKKLVSTVLEKLKFVQIVLGDNQDPHQVFDSLNFRGVRLENKDLIRNIVFQKVSDKADEAYTLYNTKWIPLEQELGERFDSYLFPFALVNKSTVTKSSLVTSLRDRWSSWNPDMIIKDLRVYVPVYNALTSEDTTSREGLTDSATVNERVSRLHRMQAPSTIFPFVFSIIKAFQENVINEEWTRHDLLQIESFVVRRAVAGLEPTGLHAVFKDLWGKTKGDPAKFVDEIDSNPTLHFPDDKQFTDDIQNKPLYGRRLAKYILEEYERGIASGDPYPEADFTIDHVMPQELTSVWQSEITEEDHKKLKDMWANLVPLSGSANAAKGQKSWSEVREFLLTETIFKTTKRLAQQHESWNAETIGRRAEQLVVWAIDRWPKRAL